ncbi:MAG: T9SS type A sorting domain-containing protein [Bacteroidota bacterium]
MRHIFFILIIILPYPGSLWAQSISQQVISSLGNNNPQLSYTVGEAIIETAEAGSFILTQGFHQPEETSVSIDRDLAALVDYKLYPSPAKDKIHLELSTSRPLDVQLAMIDMRGRKIEKTKRLIIQDLHKESFDVSQISAGIYVLQIMNRQGKLLQSLKFKKVN